MKLLFKTTIDLSFDKVQERFNRDLFVYLSPKLIPFELKRFDGTSKGNEIHIDLGIWILKQQWVSLITFEETNSSGWSFIDEGKVLPKPLVYWRHHHRVDKISETKSQIVDDIEYKCSVGWLTVLIKPFLWSVFAIRPGRYQKYFKD